ncbi:TetR/AcrR family transcriptional regulator [Rhodococcus triatomae]|uniref:DNA-binding transcriptional regulator, AcrR family n=1 Tax=Rhodococcus triatomae TaxID=300028 RepID=A0A1G8GD04_9NOCA|nr:TetR/AcrR family transcriptional regulator [Rhodococcus triatomae]QNG20418.1 TetR/AcrR family transcriptional regulator [Rhodococcus triatomae]QNG23666.1 TetR/AcrR family transcriptional regulator [Rhodococcus triatomae]SDH92171.1 DNA-binding transcriptional regulator, AcrR family [Rhodococcus triatomae]
MSGDWMRDERSSAAAQRILDAAAQLFAERGIDSVGMGDVATAAGCSRATLYRYFDNRAALQSAFVHREARRIGARVAESVSGTDDPEERVVAAALTAVRLVREEPILAAWFRMGNSGLAAELSHTSEVISSLATAFLAGSGAADAPAAAKWLVRIIVSLLTVPGADDAEERDMLARFVAPVVTGSPAGQRPADR